MAKENKKFWPVKHEPSINDMLMFKNSIDKQFESFFSGHSFLTGLPSMLKKDFEGFKPAVDMYETNKEVIVEADIPGCDKKDVNIKVDNNILTISGDKKETKEDKKKNFFHKEQYLGAFSRSISLPNYANIAKPKATYEKGILKIAFPKTELAHATHKRIEITSK